MTDQPAPALKREVIKTLADKYLPAFRELRGKPIEFVGGGKDPDGTIRLAQPVTAPSVYAFFEECYRTKLAYPFDWPHFIGRAEELVRPGGIEAATLDELRRLLTTIVRGDRFSSGVIEDMVENGVFVRILERMVVLPEQADEPR